MPGMASNGDLAQLGTGTNSTASLLHSGVGFGTYTGAAGDPRSFMLGTLQHVGGAYDAAGAPGVSRSRGSLAMLAAAAAATGTAAGTMGPWPAASAESAVAPPAGAGATAGVAQAFQATAGKPGSAMRVGASSRVNSAMLHHSSTALHGSSPAQAAAALVEPVMVLDMGEYQLKGVAQPHAVVGLQLAQLQGRRYPPVVGSGKTVCVRPGAGLVEVVEVCLWG